MDYPDPLVSSDPVVSKDGAGGDYLGVGCSLTGRRWRPRPADPETIRAHQRLLGVSEPLARAMASRRVSADSGDVFLRPTLRALFPDPSSFADMDRAARILVDALNPAARWWCSPTMTSTAPAAPRC